MFTQTMSTHPGLTHPTVSASKASSNNLDRQVAQYSLAAAVAGVGLLALAQPAQSEVVVTRKTIPIAVEQSVLVSLSNTGVADLILSLRSTFSSISTQLVRSFVAKNGAAGKGVVAAGTHIAYASALAREGRIGPSANFDSFARIEESRTQGNEREFYGQWGSNPNNRYLGVRFQLNGQTHYGWVRLTVTTDSQARGRFLSATVTAYAYETVPNKPILAGTASRTAEAPTAEVRLPESIQNPAGTSLGMLAAGADGLPLWRREEASTSR